MAVSRNMLTALCVLALGFSAARAQDETDQATLYPRDSAMTSHDMSEIDFRPDWHAVITNVPGDWMKFGITTLRPQSFPYIVGIGALTVGLVTVDPHTYSAAHGLYDESRTIRMASDAMVHVGDGKTAFGVAGAFALYGFIADDSRAIRTASQIGEVVIASGIVVQLLKRVSGRESPERSVANHSRWRFFPNWQTYNRNQSKYYSFPSGHTTTIMAVVTVIAENYSEVSWVRPVGYSVVGLVGLSLVNVGWHWYSDLPLAIGLGYTFGKIAGHPLSFGEETETGGPKVSVAPLIRREGTGVALALVF